MNKVSQKTQMGVNVWFWNKDDSEASTKFISSFLGHATFDNIREAFKGALSPLNIKSILQISMNSPNADHNFFKDLKAEFESEHGSEILKICTCILPIMHGAIKSCHAINKLIGFRVFKSIV